MEKSNNSHAQAQNIKKKYQRYNDVWGEVLQTPPGTTAAVVTSK